MTSTTLSGQYDNRVMYFFKVIVKSVMRSQLRREKLKPKFRRDEAKIESLELAIDADELIEIQLTDLVNKFESQQASRASIREIGDGTLLQMILDFLKSEDFEQVMKVILDFIKALASLG